MKKEIPGFDGKYLAYVDGRIFSKVKNRFLRCNKLTSKGYMRVRLDEKTFQWHRIIGLTFIPNPDNKPQINHKNGIKTDNQVENLEWVTNQENRDHAMQNKLHSIGENHNSKLSEIDVLNIYKLYKKGVTRKEISHIYNIAYVTVCMILQGNRWKHLWIENST